MARTTTCPSCKAEVSTAAASCPGCGHPFKAARRPTGCCGPIVLIGLGGFVLLLIVSASLPRPVPSPTRSTHVPKSAPRSASVPPKATTTEGPQSTLGIGDEAILHLPGGRGVFLAADDAWDALIDAENARDMEEVAILMARGKAIRESNGTRVKVIEAGFTSCKVRVRNGANPGWEGWVQREFVRPLTPGTRPSPSR
jgi:hypothetical protein